MKKHGMQHRGPSEIFTASMGRQVLRIHERGPFEFRNGAFYNAAKEVIFMQSVLALYDRFLVTVVAESKHRCRQTVLLTEIGRHVARSLQNDDEHGAFNRPSLLISEAASLLSAELVAS